MKKILIIAYLILQYATAFAGNTDTLIVNTNQSQLLTSRYFNELNDHDGTLTIQQVLNSNDFYTSKTLLPTLKFSKSTIWLKVVLKNNTDESIIPISVTASVIDALDLYYIDKTDKKITHISIDQLQSNFLLQKITSIQYPILPGTVNTIYLRVKSNASTIIPLRIYSVSAFLENRTIENIIMGAIAGILLVMGLYNLMLFSIVGDRSYLYYVFYILFLGLSQSLLRGYGGILFTNKAILNNYVIPIIRVCFGFSLLLFVGEFLHLKKRLKHWYKYYLCLYGLYTLLLLAILFGFVVAAYNLITITISLTAVSLLIIGVYLYVKGFKPAKFFMLGWGLFLVSILISVARNKGLIIYNDFTANIIPYSSVAELVLFSAALADKINFYRGQKIQLQNFAITVAKENERLTTEQNILLENKVKERTNELIVTNKNLSVTIEDLKNTQKKLIDTEKMASLGQLTAGVAHEINNPINFVSSNVNPLRLDFDELFLLLDSYDAALSNPGHPRFLEVLNDYKEKVDPIFIKDEITTLLNGIEEGARRTAEIVKSLRTFSSTDDLVLKTLDIDKAIYANLLILRSTIPYYIQITPLLDTIEPLNCYPGKINQMLINLISNSVYAIKAKQTHENESILIVTKDEPEYIYIEITDTGTGMTDETKQRMFEPFFTTKDVGEGTGLGLSIVFGIIEKHHGSIEVVSELGKGTKITVQLPKNLV
ncbi:hypothetical protein SAMN05216464_10383 [Mucilaginibacter pineti]|uniref:histidine kinase n=1 Tax=Mucilaginibacter pineti TaxID=1391627 RepID=A0A1G6YTL9_9SPHI|nr:7TM diverse intracellular signaling domain-containing protein [Mucilaginibacter pineti]SDD93403.1 hypothetical protein SAMN05216464_10383 [Mucilaginibacter pineti]